jgi:hypothetical protein
MVVLSKIHALGTKRKQFLGSLSASDGLRIVSNDKSILLIIFCSCIQATKINTSTQNLGITAILFFRNGDAPASVSKRCIRSYFISIIIQQRLAESLTTILQTEATG